MASHPGHMIRVQEPNGSWTERPMHEALAEFGARVLIAVRREMRPDGSIDDNGESAYRLKDSVMVAICTLGLLEERVIDDAARGEREVGS